MSFPFSVRRAVVRRSNDKTRVITVQRLLRDEASHLEELNRLVETAGHTVVGSMGQVRRPDGSFQIGKGKVHELADLVEDLNAEKIVFNNDLKPIQAHNITKITGVETIDRFQLILEIFVKRVSTQEAQLQVKLASLRHHLPRVREGVRLARRGEQPGFLGLGRYEVDVHVDAIKRQIVHIQKELRSVRNKRGLHRVRRIEHGFSLVSLAGYTYAGKTTLFNTLAAESKDVSLGDLFTTLSTTTRAVDFNDRKVLLIDTVGFIDQLPHALIEAFRSTLEETVLADAIILVIDFHESIQEIGRKLICCLDTLHEIGVYGTPLVTALNKIDQMTEEEIREKLVSLKGIVQNPVPISALNETNLEEMKRKVIELLEEHLLASFVLPSNSESLSFISSLYDHVNVLNVWYEEEIRISLKAMPWSVNKIRGQIEKLGGRLLEAAYLPKPQQSFH